MKRTTDRGYAMLTAVAAIAAFAYVAFEVMATNRGVILGVAAQADRARMAAAAEAGLMSAIHGLGSTDPARRWPIDGRAQALAFEGMSLSVVVEDERGKVPINQLDEDETRRLFALAGASGERLDRLVASFQDWVDEDDEPRPLGAERAEYAASGIQPRNGSMRTIEELGRLPGMDRQLLARIRPVTTIFGESGAFSPETASPVAIAVMGGENGVDAIQRARELAGQRTALSIESRELRGRPLTVRVTVEDGRGGRFERATLIELTGNPAQPYWIRQLD